MESPAHYTRGNIEVWDFVRDQQLNYHLGNAIKYICRAGFKGSKGEDLKKAIHYLQNELEHTSGGVPHGVPMYKLNFQQGDAAEFDR